ncbi:hypothetical protein H696_04519 [Fonticula alba]|uniref:TauD/TfdA-like domain-containing protein n=1 Tax=Fonticula alba TaxID=691883 RepID=A0A058Z597_FONAL|nr:hypothetical protein H696_04519 [Fonticula alba]KCV69103.1 hypothetical protein H696_04519 [Fonticula alba]|eukprot:XP_009496674.1 hypothetical protein H696_04519 [Fonticula alba]
MRKRAGACSGDLIVFDNRRVLHARTAFESATGERHLRGSYLRLDDWRAAWRQHCGGTAAGGSDADDCPRSDWGWEDPTAESE